MKAMEAECEVGPPSDRRLYSLSWILAVTSGTFAIPFYEAYRDGSFFLSFVSLIVTLASINYWRDAQWGWRRYIDMVVAKAAFLIYVGTALVYFRDMFYIATGIALVPTIIFVYSMITRFLASGSHFWIVFHVLFHCGIFLGQMLVIRAVSSSRLSERL